MNKDKIDKYVDDINKHFEEIENTLQFLSFAYLLKHYKKPETWYMKQQEDLPAFKKKLYSIAEQQLNELNKTYENSLYLAYTLATGQKAVVDEENKEIIVNITSKFESVLNNALNLNKTMVAGFVANVMNKHIAVVNQIGGKALLNLPKVEELYKQITKSIDNYGVKDNFNVIYRDGKSINWKSYMEMNVRTTMSQEISTLQVESGTQNKVVFWLCSQHSDCADDHVKYQGKLYYDENYTSFNIPQELLTQINDFIKDKKLISIQSVKDKKPYLTTRPNCRHYFQPVSTTQALSSSTTSLLNDLGMNKGKGDTKKYEDLVKQRYNERKIRSWKKEMQIAEMELAVNPSDEATQQRLIATKDKVRFWQKTQRTLLKNKPYLERDYDRESNEILVNDLGYRFKRLTEK